MYELIGQTLKDPAMAHYSSTHGYKNKILLRTVQNTILLCSLFLLSCNYKSGYTDLRNSYNVLMNPVIIYYLSCDSCISLQYGTDLMQVRACARVCSQVRAIASSIQHASASTSTITHVSKLTRLSRLASNEHLCKLILLELKRFNQEYILLGTSNDHIF